MKLFITYESQGTYKGAELTNENIIVDLTQEKLDLGMFKEVIEILEIKKNYVILNIKNYFGLDSVQGGFKQYIFQYCPVTIDIELEGEHSSFRFELIWY